MPNQQAIDAFESYEVSTAPNGLNNVRVTSDSDYSTLEELYGAASSDAAIKAKLVDRNGVIPTVYLMKDPEGIRSMSAETINGEAEILGGRWTTAKVAQEHYDKHIKQCRNSQNSV